MRLSAAGLKGRPYLGENHHQRLIWCLAATGEPYLAVEHYRRLVKFLREEVGDTPMPETRELVNQIKRSNTCLLSYPLQATPAAATGAVMGR